MSSVDAIQTRLRGESGTTVNVTWLDSEAAEHTADLTHSGYSSTTVDYQMVQGNVGYIRIRQFDSTTPQRAGLRHPQPERQRRRQPGV